MELSQKVAIAYLIYKRRKYKKARARQLWTHPMQLQRTAVGAFYTLFEPLRLDEQKFFNYFRMSVCSFDSLLERLKNDIAHQETYMRLTIPPVEMLAVTIRYLASGVTFTDLHYTYRMGISTIRKIVLEVCQKIWEVLLEECMPPPTEHQWKESEACFAKTANFPNCVGAIDGKHIRCIKPQHSGSLYYNYKHYFSIVLLAIADANYCFRYVDIGSYGKECDSSIFKESSFWKGATENTLNMPAPKPLPQTNSPSLPYILVGDEAFGLTDTLLRPFGGNHLTVQQRVFNYRLSRARRYVECTFGILSNKWRIFHRPINVSSDFAITIVKACCILHNFVRVRDGYPIEDALHVEGFQEIRRERNNRPTKSGKEVRDCFAEYFVSDVGSVPWQQYKI